MNIKEHIEDCREQIRRLIRQASGERARNGRTRLFRRLCKRIDDLEEELEDLERLNTPLFFPLVRGFVWDDEDKKNVNVDVFEEEQCQTES